MRLLSILIISILVPLTSLSEEVIAHKGETLTLPINSNLGTLLEFPVPLKLIPSSSKYSLRAVTTEIDPESKRPININIVNVKPLKKYSNEKIPFLLSNGRTIYIRLISRNGANRHYKIKFLKRNRSNLQSFLHNEIKLMKQMILDNPGKGFSRQVVNRRLYVGKLKGLDIRLRRKFKGQGLTGFTFILRNTSKSKKTIIPKKYRYGKNINSILFHGDHYELSSCKEAKKKNGHCVTALRIVFREPNFRFPGSYSDFPFMTSKLRGGKQ